MAKINDETRRRAGLVMLAAACAFVAGSGLHMLLLGAGTEEALHGGGRVLFWGGLAAMLLARMHGRSLPGIILAIWTGAGLILASWW